MKIQEQLTTDGPTTLMISDPFYGHIGPRMTSIIQPADSSMTDQWRHNVEMSEVTFRNEAEVSMTEMSMTSRILWQATNFLCYYAQKICNNC